MARDTLAAVERLLGDPWRRRGACPCLAQLETTPTVNALSSSGFSSAACYQTHPCDQQISHLQGNFGLKPCHRPGGRSKGARATELGDPRLRR